jgi:hypothetical protein
MLSAAEIQLIRNADPSAVLPGIDTLTGNPYAMSSLLEVTKITQNTSPSEPYAYLASRNIVYVNQNGAVLSGINFGNATVEIAANNVTIKDCTFSGAIKNHFAIEQNGTGATVENCTFVGSKISTWGGGWIVSNDDITIKDNDFIDTGSDSIDIGNNGGTGLGGSITGNYFSGSGYASGAHADAIWMTASTEPFTITDNLIDETWNADAPANANSDIRLTAEIGNLSNVTVSGNYLFGGSFNVEALNQSQPSQNKANTVSDVSITNNDLGYALYGQYYPTTSGLATVSGTTAVDFTNPTASTAALTAYVAAGVPTAPTGSGATTVMGNGVVSADLFAGSGETNFVGGYGSQLLFGGQGANILTYLAIGDGGDRAAAFDPAKDVIDLSHIDADITTAGLQDFTFIGSAPFSGGAQVRYQLNPTTDSTTVQAILAGDTTADFTITLAGLAPLTAANFALTPSQSSAALADGAALTESHVTTAAGAPTEYAYSNVQGRAYTTYESFYGPGYENLAADDLNLSANANTLVLYDPTQTVTKGGAAESLTIGAGADPLTYHPVETIDATASTGERFVFSAGFGNETITGFSASGSTPDAIQIATSAFSYLTPGMTQAEDLAAVLSQATRTSSGLTIHDTHGDSLTLTGVTPSTIAVDPGMIAFT